MEGGEWQQGGSGGWARRRKGQGRSAKPGSRGGEYAVGCGGSVWLRWLFWVTAVVVLGDCGGGGTARGATKERKKATMVVVMGGDFQFCLLVLGWRKEKKWALFILLSRVKKNHPLLEDQGMNVD
ncbi:hypothetical protein SOVF_104750 [Spinacia oleracea]|nr:hypothetical protein SOVF_104750 [Spinacia oleracea]